MKIRQIMTQPVVTVREDATLEEVALLLHRYRIDAVPVVAEDGSLRGMISVSEFVAKPKPIPFSTLRLPQVFGRWLPHEGVEQLYRDARRLKASEAMRSTVPTVTENHEVEQVLKQMAVEDLHVLPVVRGAVPVGVVTRHDLMRMMLSAPEDDAGAPEPRPAPPPRPPSRWRT